MGKETASENGVRSNRSGDIADFRFSRRRPSAILDFQKIKILTFIQQHLEFVYACLDHHWRVFVGICQCAKFGSNRWSSFDDMQVLVICTLGVKMPIHIRKMVCLGGLTSHWAAVSTRPWKRLSCAKHVIWPTVRQNLFIVSDSAQSQEQSKKAFRQSTTASLHIPSWIIIHSGGLEPQKVVIWPFSLGWQLAFITASTAIQAVIMKC